MANELTVTKITPEMREMIEATKELAPQVVHIQSQTGMFDYGDKDLRATVTGVVLGDVRPRAYWEKPLDQGGEAVPDCSSPDGYKPNPPREGGHPVMNETCAGCPMDQWGTDVKGGPGKGCKQKAIVMILETGSIVPVAISVPVTSIRAIDTFYQKLLGKGQGYSAVVAEFSLEGRKNAKQVAYSGLVVKKLRDATDDEMGIVETFKPYVPKFKATLSGAREASEIPF